MACILAICSAAAHVVVAGLGAPAQGVLETSHLEANTSCGMPLVGGPENQPVLAKGSMLLQTTTKLSALSAPAHIGSSLANRSIVGEGFPGDAPSHERAAAGLGAKPTRRVPLGMPGSAVSLLLGAQQTLRVPLGMPGSAASLLTALGQGARQHRLDVSNFRIKLAIVICFVGLLVVCSSFATGQKGTSPSRPEALVAAGLTVKSQVTAARAFTSDGEPSCEIGPGQQGAIAEIDPEGDLLVKFEHVDGAQWVLHRKALDVLRPQSGPSAPRDVTDGSPSEPKSNV